MRVITQLTHWSGAGERHYPQLSDDHLDFNAHFTYTYRPPSLEVMKHSHFRLWCICMKLHKLNCTNDSKVAVGEFRLPEQSKTNQFTNVAIWLNLYSICFCVCANMCYIHVALLTPLHFSFLSCWIMLTLHITVMSCILLIVCVTVSMWVGELRRHMQD